MRNMEISPDMRRPPSGGDNSGGGVNVKEEVRKFWNEIGMFSKLIFIINILSFII